jgi:hypothetical protein
MHQSDNNLKADSMVFLSLLQHQHLQHSISDLLFIIYLFYFNILITLLKFNTIH